MPVEIASLPPGSVATAGRLLARAFALKMPEPISWRMHWRLIVAAAILAAPCWGGVLYWHSVQIPTPVIVGPVVSASPAP